RQRYSGTRRLSAASSRGCCRAASCPAPPARPAQPIEHERMPRHLVSCLPGGVRLQVERCRGQVLDVSTLLAHEVIVTPGHRVEASEAIPEVDDPDVAL